MRLLKLLLVVLVYTATPAVAGPYEDGVAASDRKDYATALRLFRPLAPVEQYQTLARLSAATAAAARRRPSDQGECRQHPRAAGADVRHQPPRASFQSAAIPHHLHWVLWLFDDLAKRSE
jgi:hypothetical protein